MMLMKLTRSSLQHIEILSLSKDAEMIRMKMMNPSLDQTGGQKGRKARKESESTSAPKDKTSKSTDLSKEGSKSKTRLTDKSAQAE
nr:hypothetical protein [Tanacetum cinerariifolium]